MCKILFVLAALASAAPALADSLTHGYEMGAKVVRQSAPADAKAWWKRLISPREADLVVAVSDAASGAPLSGVEILVGAEVGVPFPGNLQSTGADGTVRFSAEALRNPNKFTVTAAKDGYSTFTLHEVRGERVEIQLQAQAAPSDYGFLNGKVSGWPTGYGRRTLEVGLFIPGLRPQSLLSFDIGQIISSYTTEMDVGGTRVVPGNLVMPPQDKTYMIFPIHLEKPEYIMPLPFGTRAHMSAVVGAVGLSAAIDGMKNKDFLSVINNTNLTHVEWSDPITVRSDERLDIRVSRPLEAQAIKTSTFAVPKGMDVLSVSLFDPSGTRDDFVPLDVKSRKAEQITGGKAEIPLGKLKDAASRAATYVFTTLFKRSEFINQQPNQPVRRAISASVKPLGADGKSVENKAMLGLMRVSPPSADKRSYQFTTANTAELAADLLFLNLYSLTKNNLTKGKTKKLLWSNVLPAGSTSAHLPKLGDRPVLPPADASLEEVFYWEVVALKARPAPRPEFDLGTLVKDMEHLSSVAEQF